MKIGTDRIVITIPWLGLVIKLPAIHLIAVIKELGRLSFGCLFGEEKEFSRVRLAKFITRSIAAKNAHAGIRSLLFAGVITNWSEFIFFVKTRNSFLQPTYFSFFGFLNLQKIGKPIRLRAWEFWPQIDKFIGYNNRNADGHHFTKPNNFCEHLGKLRIFDYGSPVTQKIISEFGEKIYNDFDLKKI